MARLQSISVGDVAVSAGRNPYRNEKSIEFKFRVKRFALIQSMIEKILREKGEAEILDLGGTEDYWLIGREFVQQHRNRLKITLVNTADVHLENNTVFASLTGDAAATGLFQGKRFDLVHSNSVIEHVGDWPRMLTFAQNVRRLAPRYYVQTPNYWFPYEPHFRFPGFQYLPEAVRVKLIMTRPLGFFRRIEDRAEAQEIIDTHRLLSTRQMRIAFPDGEVRHERFVGLAKSIIAVRGHDA
jgi:hypothetical protein